MIERRRNWIFHAKDIAIVLGILGCIGYFLKASAQMASWDEAASLIPTIHHNTTDIAVMKQSVLDIKEDVGDIKSEIHQINRKMH